MRISTWQVQIILEHDLNIGWHPKEISLVTSNIYDVLRHINVLAAIRSWMNRKLTYDQFVSRLVLTPKTKETWPQGPESPLEAYI